MTGYCQTEGGATSTGEGRVSEGEGEEEEKQVCSLQSYSAPEIEVFHWPCLLANVQSKEKFFASSSNLGAEAESAGGVAVEIETVVVPGAEAEIVTGGGIETEIETGTGTGIGGSRYRGQE